MFFLFSTFLWAIPLVSSLRLFEHPLESRIAYVYGVKNIAKVGEPMMKHLQILFEKHPLLIFKEVEATTPKEFLHFVKQFDPDHDAAALERPEEYPDQLLQPFDQFPDCAHVAPRGNMALENFHSIRSLEVKPYDAFVNHYVWHADMIGHEYKLPNVVTGFYIMECPLIGGDTDFISGEAVYQELSVAEKLASQNILIEMNRRKFVMGELTTDYAGVQRLEKHVEAELGNTQIPLVLAPDSLVGLPSVVLMPTFFEKVVGWSVKESREWLRDFMTKSVLPHRVTVQWKRGDLAVFNNRRFIHSSTPARNYLENDQSNRRLLLQTFIPTNRPLLGIKPRGNNCYACYNAKWIKDQEKSIISAHDHIKFTIAKTLQNNGTLGVDSPYYILAKKRE